MLENPPGRLFGALAALDSCKIIFCRDGAVNSPMEPLSRLTGERQDVSPSLCCADEVVQSDAFEYLPDDPIASRPLISRDPLATRASPAILFVGHAVGIGDRLHLQAPRRLEIEDRLSSRGALLDRNGTEQSEHAFRLQIFSAALMSST